jgi:hypothetical protein
MDPKELLERLIRWRIHRDTGEGIDEGSPSYFERFLAVAKEEDLAAVVAAVYTYNCMPVPEEGTGGDLERGGFLLSRLEELETAGVPLAELEQHIYPG